jgi:hypothetical protein
MEDEVELVPAEVVPEGDNGVAGWDKEPETDTQTLVKETPVAKNPLAELDKEPGTDTQTPVKETPVAKKPSAELDKELETDAQMPVKETPVAKPPSVQSQTGSIRFVIAVSLIVSIGGVLGGYSHGFPSPTLLDLQLAYERGDRVTAFSSSSDYAGLFAVS